MRHQLPSATPDLKPELPIHIDSTMLTHFRSCPRKFYNEFCLGLRTNDVSVHLHAGGAFAHAIETARRHFYDDGLSPDLAVARSFKEYLSFWGDYETDDREKKSFFNVWRGVCSYFEHFPLATDHIRPFVRHDLSSTYEFSFGIPLPIDHPSGQPFIFCGRIDMLGEYLGKPCIVDEKTASGLGPSFAEKWKMRGQFLGYCWALRQLGVPVDLAIIRATSFAVRDISHLEVIQPYSDKLIDRWYDETLRTVEEIVTSWNRMHFRLDFGDSCTAFNRECEYTTLCTAPGREETWYPDYRVRRWNPLLRNPVDPRDYNLPLSQILEKS